MQFIDSHSHLNSAEFNDSWKNIVVKAKNAGISTIINCGSDLDDSQWAIEQAEGEPIVYTTVGVHPEHLAGVSLDTQQLVNNLRRLISSSKKVVAIGEIGLDYTLDASLAPKELQLELIKPQLDLAAELQLPVIIHIRDPKGSTECFDDTLELIQGYTNRSDKPLTGVFHCWVGTPEQAQKALTTGFYISLSGILTYKSAGYIVDVAQQIPSEKLLIETDAPYLTPEPARSEEKPASNEPQYVILTAEKLANIRHVTIEEIASLTAKNAKTLFNLNFPIE